MRQQFTIARRLFAACAALLLLAAVPVAAQDLKLAPDAPQRYVVKPGDTLWSISGRFLKDPWRWPDIWRMNRDQIKNPHWIYPGDTVVFDTVDGKPRLTLERGGRLVSGAAPRDGGGRDGAPREPAPRETIRLSPSIRSTPIDVGAIPSIPAGDIQPFLTRPLITGPEGLVNGAEVVAARDARVIRGDGDTLYVVGIDKNAGDSWYLYRPGRTFTNVDNPRDVIGYEQHFLGTAKVERYGEVSTVRITNAREEIVIGDRLVPQPRSQLINYSPHAPTKPIDGHVIALERDASEAGVGWIVTIDRGTQDGLDIGAVLAVYRSYPPIQDPRPSKEPDRIERFIDQTISYQPERLLALPEERNGLLFVYRVFDRVSYGLLVRTYDPIEVGNVVRNP